MAVRIPHPIPYTVVCDATLQSLSHAEANTAADQGVLDVSFCHVHNAAIEIQRPAHMEAVIVVDGCLSGCKG